MRENRNQHDETPNPFERAIGDYLRSSRSNEHLTPDQFLELAERGKHAKEYERWMQHIFTCPECRRTYLELKELRALAAEASVKGKTPVKTALWIPIALASVAVLILVLWLGVFRGEPQQVVEQPSKSPSASPKPIESEVQPTTPPSEQAERPSSPSPTAPKPEPAPQPPSSRPRRNDVPTPAPQRVQIAHNLFREGEEVYEGNTPLPSEWRPFALQYAEAPPTLRSVSPTTISIQLTEPPLLERRSVETTQPVFTWKSVPSAEVYNAKLFRLINPDNLITSDDLEELKGALSIEGTTARTTQSLEAGVYYLLRLEAVVKVPDTTQFATLRTDYSFYVLTESEKRQLEQARRLASQIPLTTAIVLYELGYYREALELIPPDITDSKVQQWRQHISRRLEERRRNPSV